MATVQFSLPVAVDWCYSNRVFSWPNMTMAKTLGRAFALLLMLASCSDGDPGSLPFFSLRGERGAADIIVPNPDDLVACERPPGCASTILTVVRSGEEAHQWMRDVPTEAIKIDFRSQMVVIWRGIIGTSYQYSVDRVVNNDAGIVIHATICHVRDVNVINFLTRVSIAIDVSEKPISVEVREVWDIDNTLVLNREGLPVEQCKKMAQ